MIISMIAKRMGRSLFDIMSQDHIDTDALLKVYADDCTYGGTSDFGVEATVKGKKAIAEWHRRYLEDFPKLKFTVKNICIRETFPLLSAFIGTIVIMTEWSLTQTDKEGKESRYDGITVSYAKRMKAVYVSEYVSFRGLPQLSTLMKESGKA